MLAAFSHLASPGETRAGAGRRAMLADRKSRQDRPEGTVTHNDLENKPLGSTLSS